MAILFRFLANLTYFVHLFFIIFSVFGALICIRWPKLILLHIPCLTWATLIWFFRWSCPLTPLEKYFLEQAGLSTYEGGFIAHYIYPLIYVGGFTYSEIVILGILLILGNILAYTLIYRFHLSRSPQN